MEKTEDRRSVIDAEREILRAMCLGTPERTIRAEAIDLLANYPFADSAHQLLFDALREIRTDVPRLIREQLPAHLSNKGFPDMDVETFFEPHKLTATQAIALMRFLCGAAQKESRRQSAPG